MCDTRGLEFFFIQFELLVIFVDREKKKSEGKMRTLIFSRGYAR